MKKRIISLLLVLALFVGTIPLCTVPAMAEEAEETVPAGNLSLLTQNLNTVLAATVCFGTDAGGNPIAFRVIGDETHGVTAPEGSLTLVSKGFTGDPREFDNWGSNQYGYSSLRNVLDASVSLTSVEEAAVTKRTLEGGKSSGTDCDGGLAEFPKFDYVEDTILGVPIGSYTYTAFGTDGAKGGYGGGAGGP